jgi:hypothetical protein
MLDHGSTDPAAASRFDDVHGLQLSVVVVQALEGPDAQKLTVTTESEKRDVRVKETFEIERMDILGRTDGIGMFKVVPRKLADVLGSGVVDGDLALGHGGNLGQQGLGS